jgi:hypothetical protein
VVAQGAAAALRTRLLPQPTASSLVVDSFFCHTCWLFAGRLCCHINRKCCTCVCDGWPACSKLASHHTPPCCRLGPPAHSGRAGQHRDVQVLGNTVMCTLMNRKAAALRHSVLVAALAHLLVLYRPQLSGAAALAQAEAHYTSSYEQAGGGGLCPGCTALHCAVLCCVGSCSVLLHCAGLSIVLQ